MQRLQFAAAELDVAEAIVSSEGDKGFAGTASRAHRANAGLHELSGSLLCSTT
jgi:hypothetical protein